MTLCSSLAPRSSLAPAPLCPAHRHLSHLTYYFSTAMTPHCPFFLLAYLLASFNTERGAYRGEGSGIAKSRSGRVGANARNSGRGRGRGGGRGRGQGSLGRKRYNRDGYKKRVSFDDSELSRQEDVKPLPPLTVLNGPRPFYFTCRHTYEKTLMEEIERHAEQLGSNFNLMSPYPGLVRVEDHDGCLSTHYDPVYALQTMPQSVVVSAESIKGIAKEVLKALLGIDYNGGDDGTVDELSSNQKQLLLSAPKGSLRIHSLVPGMCKGQSKPAMQHRSEKICEEIQKMMANIFPAARKSPTDNTGNVMHPNESWILQVMIQSPNIAVASITKCETKGPGQFSSWPNYCHPLGLAKVDITEKMPSSAYRKLMEGIECMGISPEPSTTVVDLGACPGGWTSVMRRLGCRVVAVDRSELDSALMRDGMVEFVRGDAFAFEPSMVGIGPDEDCWMISDVIAYPERCTELLDRWCGGRWASNMIVTMKFQGEEPDLEEVEKAIGVVEGHDYGCRVKHFFNNKNEVTFMISEKTQQSASYLKDGMVGTVMYPTSIL